MKKHHSCQNLHVFYADLAGNGRFWEQFKKTDGRNQCPQKTLSVQGFPSGFRSCSVPARKVLKSGQPYCFFNLNLLNRSEKPTMQTISKKSGKKSPNRKIGIFEDTSLHEQIEARAHEIYLDRGAEPGHEMDDWLQAEREIMGWV
jgi:Protein of unknown function (DUF2934)